MLFFRTAKSSIDPNKETVAQLLGAQTALADLSKQDARVVVDFMLLRRVSAGTVLIREDECTLTDFMILILKGEVLVAYEAGNAEDSLVMSILGPGSLIGETGVLDGAPRSATCTAASELSVAVLSRAALHTLVKKDPAVAARLMLLISKRLSDRLREANRKIKTFGGINRALQQELDAAHNTNGDLTQ